MLTFKLILNLFTDMNMPDPEYQCVKHPPPPRRRNSHMAWARANGFTLVELMVVIFIIGLLTTVVVINVLPNRDKAMVQKAKADIAILSQALETYRLDNFNYPTDNQGLQALVTPDPAATGGRVAGYIKKLPDDPWGRPYQYNIPGRNGAFEIYSLGADGAPGGENDDADIFGE